MSPLVSQLLLWGLLGLVAAIAVWVDRRLDRDRIEPDDVVFYLDARTVDRLKTRTRAARREADALASDDLTIAEGSVRDA